MINILSYLPTKRKTSPSGWISFNAICCTHNGERFDTRGRGGVLISADGGFQYNCFNCGFTAGYTIGQPLSRKTRSLFTWLGVDPVIIRKLSLDNLKYRNEHGLSGDSRLTSVAKFNPIELPVTAEALNYNNPTHQRFVKYLEERRVDFNKYQFYVSPSANGRESNRIIIPFTHDNKLVGYTARFLDSSHPKYINCLQTGYVFNTDRQSSKWQYVFVTEGVFDAIAIDGVGLLHNDSNQLQTDTINSLCKQVVVVPDRDKAGDKLIQRAITNGWSVSFPDWDNDVKDASAAVAKYGKLITLLSIVESIESSKLKIELIRKQNAKRLQS